MQPYSPGGPIAAIATPLAPAALGVVRASGEGALELAARVFSRPRALLGAPGGTLRHGWVVGADGEPADEVLAAVFRAPKSFTGEDSVEFYCHGGAAALTAVYGALLAAGFRAAEPGEFSFRAFVNGKTDLTRAEATREIAAAKTAEARRRAARRLSGALEAELAAVKALLVEARAEIEAEAEYPEDEAAAGAFDGGKLREAEARLARLCGSWAGEKLYQDGARVVLCGKTNAGKSSLFNALLKEERAIVSAAPGTTRDWLESWASFGGVPVLLYDTAGIRECGDEAERAGVERARALAAAADAALYVIDGAEMPEGGGAEAAAAAAALGGSAPVVTVFNKADAASDAARQAAGGALWVSAKTGEGIPALVAAVARLLGAEGGGAGGGGSGGGSGSGSAGGSAALGSARQKAACAEALDAVRQALSAPERGFPQDAAAADIEDALFALGEITGEVTADDVLASVFSTFCLGK